MPKKLFIGLVVIIISIFGVSGYAMFQTGGNTPSLKTNTTNLVPAAAMKNNNYASSPKREICNECAVLDGPAKLYVLIVMETVL